jgi:hypothetical protein
MAQMDIFPVFPQPGIEARETQLARILGEKFVLFRKKTPRQTVEFPCLPGFSAVIGLFHCS